MSTHENGLSMAMMNALGSMPVKLRQYVTGGPFHLPPGSPRGGSLKALYNRGLIELDLDNNVWIRTPLGEQVWERR